MTSSRIVLGLTVAALAATVALLGGLVRGAPTQASPSTELLIRQQIESFEIGFPLGASTPEIVGRLQVELQADPSNERAFTLLGLAYEQRARETGDPSYYGKAQGSLERARQLDSSDPLVYSGLGSLALSRHRFRDALVMGRRARDLSPGSARAYGVIGDALVELGRYRAAFRAFDTMSRLRPSVASYARVSYGRELLGRTRQAIAAMKLAVDAAGGAAEPTAWTHVQLGKLFFLHGRYAIAAREAHLALAVFPGYPYALDALAQAEAAQGRISKAIALERRAMTAVPLPQYVSFLGDLYAISGHRSLAHRQYALIGAIGRLLRANGVRTDLELALFQVDHGIDLPGALRRARAARAARPSIDGEDVLAWALARNGRCAEALVRSQRALRLGTQDPLKLFHRGMIERCLGRRAAARAWLGRALRLSPHFSLLWAPAARKALR